jgi:hypothetical protein
MERRRTGSFGRNFLRFSCLVLSRLFPFPSLPAIHQPRSSIFDLLDMLVLVSEGRIIYAGMWGGRKGGRKGGRAGGREGGREGRAPLT